MPQAIVANQALEWVEVDESTADVATRVGTDRIGVRLIFDEDGDIAQTIAERRESRRGMPSHAGLANIATTATSGASLYPLEAKSGGNYQAGRLPIGAQRSRRLSCATDVAIVRTAPNSRRHADSVGLIEFRRDSS